jgi:hypothetical protein
MKMFYRFLVTALASLLCYSLPISAQLPSIVIPQGSPKFSADLAAVVELNAFAPTSFSVELGNFNSDYTGFAPIMTKLGWSVDGNVLRLKYLTTFPQQDDFLGAIPRRENVILPALAPGEYEIELGTQAREGQYRRTDSRRLRVTSAAETRAVVSLANRPTQRYFMTASSAEVQALLALRAADANLPQPTVDWSVAEESMRAWSSAGAAPSVAKAVCRFYHPTVNTHFYSANPSDCELLSRTPPFVNEGIAFRALVPENGSCPIGTDSVYRLFSASLSNHRYTRIELTKAAFAAAGWNNEGIAFCSPTT